MDKEALKDFGERLDRVLDSFPKGLLNEEPRYQLTGEIIPPELRGADPKEEE